MKYKHIIIVFLIALIWDALGAFFKVAHFEIGIITGNHFLLIGLIVKLLGAVLLIIRLFNKRKTKAL